MSTTIVSNSSASVNPDIAVATDLVGGEVFQRVKIALGDAGVDEGPVSLDNPLPVNATGELMEVLEATRTLLQSLTRTVGLFMPDITGRARVTVENITNGLFLSSVSSVTTLQNMGIASYSTNDAVPSLMHLQADNLRRNITVS